MDRNIHVNGYLWKQNFQFFKFIHNHPHFSKGNYRNLILRTINMLGGRLSVKGKVGGDFALCEEMTLKLIGHSHIRTTEGYPHSTDDRKVEAIRSLSFGV